MMRPFTIARCRLTIAPDVTPGWSGLGALYKKENAAAKSVGAVGSSAGGCSVRFRGRFAKAGAVQTSSGAIGNVSVARRRAGVGRTDATVVVGRTHRGRSARRFFVASASDERRCGEGREESVRQARSG